MDGVVQYPGLSIWGSTNNPERIPMPMIRRFPKVFIVGELSEEDRVELLRYYVEFLPTTGFSEKDWQKAAKKLDGATGDVIRKVADHLWREMITSFVESHPEEAKNIVTYLREEISEGRPFDIDSFDDKQRFNFKNKLGNYFNINPDSLNQEIDLHLQNLAIRSEIDNAVATYKRVKEFIEDLNSTKSNSKFSNGLIQISN